MQTWTWNEAGDFPPVIRRTGEDVYDLLRANRFAEAKDAVRTWRDDNPIRLLIEGEGYQTAICDLGRVLFPQSGDRDGNFFHFERSLAERAVG